MIAVLSVLIVATLSILITRIAAMALMQTGMSRESARFQARSAFSGVGFTTKEAESIVNHPVRRRIVMLLMLVGNVGIATAIATIVLSVYSTAGKEQWWLYALGLLAGMILLSALALNRRVEHWMNRAIAWGLTRWTNIGVADYVAVLKLQNDYAVSEMKVEPGDWLDGKDLAEAALPREGVLILGIQRQSGQYVGTPRAKDIIHAGDTLILYALSTRLAELDQRESGHTGEQAHTEAVAEHQQTLEEQK